MNEAGEYIKNVLKKNRELEKENQDRSNLLERIFKTAVNKALEQVGKDAKEKLHQLIFDDDKWLDAISHKDLDKIITNLKL